MIDRELVNLAQTAPLAGYVESDNYQVREIMRKYDKSMYYVVEVLEALLKKGEIKELDVRYDVVDKHLLHFRYK